MAATAVRVIEPRRGWAGVRWGDVWRHRGLLYVLLWRDIRIRYRHTALGIAWALLQPLASMAIFVLLLGRWGGMQDRAGIASYSSYVLSGIVPWLFFTAAVSAASRSLLNASALIGKTSFPRVLLPLTSVATAAVDFAVALLILAVFVAASGFVPSLQLALLPLILVTFVAFTVGVCLFVSSITVQYRDVQYAIPFALQIGMFLAPIVYPVAIVPERWRMILMVNPLTGFVEGLRAALLGHAFPWIPLAIAMAWSIAAVVGGALWFGRIERSLPDIL